MAKLDSLIVDLQLNTAELKKGLDEANNKLSAFGKKVDELAQVITFEKVGGMALDVAKKLGQFVLAGSESIDKMGKLATVSGMTAEEFSRLAYAAEMNGLTVDEFGKAMLTLGKNLTAAASGGKEQIVLFDVLGVKATDSSGKIRATSAVINDLANKFGTLRDGAAKSQLLIDVFGKGGERLGDVFKDGAEGLAQFAAEADKFGITVSSKAAQSAADFNDALTKLQLIANGLAGRVAGELAPALENLTTNLTQAKGGTDALDSAATVLATTFKVLVSAAAVVGAAFEIVGKEIARTLSIIVNVARGDLDSALDDVKGYGTDIVDALSDAKDRIKAVWSDSPVADSMSDASDEAKKSADEIAAALEKQKKALQEYESALKELTKVAVDYETKVSSFGKGPLALLEERLNSGDLSIKLKQIGDRAAEMRDRILEAAEALQSLELGKLNQSIEFERERTANRTQREVDAAQRDYRLAGSGGSPTDAARLATSGFKDFDDALKKYQESIQRYTSLMGDVEIAKAQNDIESAQKFQLAADTANNAVEDARNAMTGFRDLAVEAHEKMREAVKAIANAIGAAALQMASKFGELGDVIQAGVQGFQSGGWVGAIIGVVIELFSKFERFGEIIEAGSNQIGMVIDQIRPALEVFTDAFLNFMQMSQVITKIIFQFLGPIIRVFGRILDFVVGVLTPILALVSTLLESMAPLTEGLFSLIDAFSPLPYIMKFVATVFNFVSLGVLGIMLGVYTAWGAVLNVVRDVMKFFLLDTKEIDATIATHAAKTREISDRMSSIWRNITDPYANTDDLTTPEPVDTGPVEIDLDDLGGSARDASAGLDEFTHSLTNVPQGFKYQLRAFEAMSADALQPGIEYNNITIEGSLVTERELFDLWAQLRKKEVFRTGGITINNR